MTFAIHQPAVIRVAAFILSATLTASCTTVLDTVPTQDARGQLCETNGGAYFLPKKHLTAQINQDAEGKYYTLALGDPKAYADRRQHYCLDYLASAAASDTIEISRNADGLLQKISTVAEDKSLKIAEKIIDAGLVAVTGNPAFTMRSFRTDAGEKLIADFDFDPLDEQQLADINATLITYGYCIYVGHYTPDPRQMCAKPSRHIMAYALDSGPTYPSVIPFEEGKHGILYRPDMTYRIVVMRKRDPGAHEGWKIHQIRHVELPNIAPVISIPVERSLFVKRETTLEFKDGVLQDVTIKKPSELLAFSEFTLKLAQAIVAVPAEAIKIRIASTNNRERLINAQTQLIATKQAYADQVAKLRETEEKYGGSIRRDLPFSPRVLPAIDLDSIVGEQCIDAPNQESCKSRVISDMNGRCQNSRHSLEAARKCLAESG